MMKLIYAGILAAGLGVRMHREDMPKQFLRLGEKPIIIHTLEQFFVNAQVEKVIVVAPETWRLYTEDLIAQYDSMGKDITVISGGVNKTESIYMTVQYIGVTWGINGNDLLIAHDAIRPFVTQRIINENITAAMSYGAATTAMETNDTILISKDGHTTSAIPSKNLMLAEQTPQTYILEKLRSAYTYAAERNIALNEESELARLYIKSGGGIQIVQGEYFNMKIINPYDLKVANALLKERTL
jgi:2-C-methyl-D-erythritol 4-phosphate cytidylyltransferase